MLYTLLTSVITILLLAILTSGFVLRHAVPERPFRRILLLFVVLTPPLAIYALIKSLFSRPKPIPYIEELGRIEDEIESERARIFETKIVTPSFSSVWQTSYLIALEKSAMAVAHKLEPSINASMCRVIQR